MQIKAIEIRKQILSMIYEAKSGHIGGAFSSVDILVTLFYDIMNFSPENMNSPQRDRFILSKGHSVEGYYSILADRGFFSKCELKTFCKYGSSLIGHPNRKVPGVEINTGALGHGLSVGVGIALAGKRDKIPYNVYVVMGDGEQAEGSNWEAAMSASHYELDNLCVIVDKNGLQISGSTEEVMSLGDLSEKWKSFGWDTITVDGNNIAEIATVLKDTKKTKGKPRAIIANTVKGKGVSFMENNKKWHHGVPSEEQLKVALNELEIVMGELCQCE